MLCLTYNHARFIRNALDSFISQEGVSFEILVCDDASNDGTTEIVQEYVSLYPHIVRHILQPGNVGAEENFTQACRHIRGKYVAFCDGDDYFITRDKLRKQAQMLREDPSLSICFSSACMVFEDGSKTQSIVPDGALIAGRRRFTLADLMNTNMIPTCTVMYRWFFHGRLVEDHIPRGILPGDYYLHMVHAREGDIIFLDEVTSVYRRHSDGMWWDYDRDWDKQNLNHGFAELKFHIAVARRILSNQDSIWYEENRAVSFAALLLILFVRHGDIDSIRKLKELAPDVLKRSAERLRID